MIEAALRESGRPVSGPSGAATKLGLPGPTLESKVSKDQQEALLQILSRSHLNTFLSEHQSTVVRFRKRCENSQPGYQSNYLVSMT
jgi:hypothetical protein